MTGDSESETVASVRRQARPTKADVARLAKVSTATVSYVLNNVAGQTISAQTQSVVREAARQLGYRPNLAARNLAIGGSGIVLYIVPQMAMGELAMEVGSRLTTALAQHGIVLSLQFETDDAENVVDAISNLNPMAVAGTFPLSGAALEAVKAADIPQIHLGSQNLRTLASLDQTVGELRVAHLASRGHRRLAFAYSDDRKLRPLGEYWLRGIRTAARTRDLPEVEVGTLAANGSNAAEVVSRWFEQGVTAVCAQSDEVAFVLLHGIRHAGLRCPGDLAVMGVDTIALSAVSDPPLTSVAFHAEEIVEVAVSAMMRTLGYPTRSVKADGDFARLVEREST
ncbi:LacI family DNA-binding transcriptional regulator [Nocardia sp. NPDC005366]|uniref:LacI family DNA-binding transcriptional regulator n=1 Tax=Nocardia sp. NPDC005366 TaxID=3156878 RepID=UPI0033A5C1CC